MNLTGDEITGLALADFGRAILIGSTPAVGIFNTGPREVIRNGVMVITDTPSLLLDTTTAALVTTDSTVITISSVNYQAYNKVPDGAGFVELDLTRDY